MSNGSLHTYLRVLKIVLKAPTQAAPGDKKFAPEAIDGLFGVLKLLDHGFESQLLVVQANFPLSQFTLRKNELG